MSDLAISDTTHECQRGLFRTTREPNLPWNDASKSFIALVWLSLLEL